MFDVDRLTALGKQYLLAKEHFDRYVRSIIRSGPTMSDKTRFWKMTRDLSEVIEHFLGKRDNVVKFSIRRWMFDEGANFHIMPEFIRTYSKLKGALSVPGLDANCIDSLPLAGKAICLSVTKGIVKDVDTLSEMLQKQTPVLEQFILNSQNFVEQQLEAVYAEMVCAGILLDNKSFSQQLQGIDY